MKRAICLCSLAVLMVSFHAYSAIDPCVDVKWEGAGGGKGEWSWSYGDGERQQDPANPFRYMIQDQRQLGGCSVELDMIYDEDPYVNGILVVTNNTAFDNVYTFVFTSPVNPAITPSTLYGGSMSGSYTDSDKDGSILVSTVSPDPLFQGKIDGVDIFPIYSDPYSWTALNIIGSGDILADGDWVDNPGPAATSSISIEYKFLLSAGDSVSLNGTFEVIPEPATLSILCLGGLALLRKRK